MQDGGLIGLKSVGIFSMVIGELCTVYTIRIYTLYVKLLQIRLDGACSVYVDFL